MKLLKMSEIGGRKLFAFLRGGDAMSRTSMKAVCLGAFALACSSLFAANAATLQVAISGSDVNVTAPAGALDDTSKIYLVWGATDFGDDMASWPSANRALYSGAVSSAAATYTFDGTGIPAGSIVRAFATSDIRLIDSWVKIAANQYINTGIPDNSAYGVDFKYRYDGTSTGGAYSSVIASGVDQFTIGRYNNDKLFYLRYGGNNDNNGGDGYSTAEQGGFSLPDTTNPHVYRVFGGTSYLDGNTVKTGLNNGTQAKKGSPRGVLAKTGKTILLGVSWVKTGAGNVLSGRYCHGEWHYAKVLNSSGNALVNLVPALRGDTTAPEAGFYDTVSGTFFAKSGTGGALAYDTSASVTNTIAKPAAFSAAIATGMTAYWTGAGDRQNVNDPANWSCTDATGAAVVSAPDVRTLVKIEGATTFNVPAGQTLSYASIEFNNVSLAADCDWRGLAAVNTPVAPVALTYLDAPRGSYIDTGFKPNEKTRVVLDVTVRGNKEYWLGAWNTSYNTGAYAVCNDEGGIYSGFGNSGGGSQPVIANGRHTIDFDGGVVKVDGNVHTDRSGQVFQVNYNLYLFAQNRIGVATPRTGQTTIRLHACQIYDNGMLVRDYVPVRFGGTVCLYDRCTKSCSYNAGSGTFASDDAGTALPDVVSFDSSIDLAGHKLTLAHIAGTGEITDTVGGGELWIDVPAGSAPENTGLSFTGSLKLVKDGAGAFTASKAGQTYTGGTVVMNGLAKSGVAAGPWGPSEALVTVADTGAAFDWNGAVSASATPYSFDIKGTGIANGGAIVFTPGTGAGYTAYCLADLTLSGDALVVDPAAGRNAYCGFIVLNRTHLLTLNGHALTIDAGDKFNFKNVRAVGSGTVVFMSTNTGTGGARMASFWDVASDFSSVTLDIAANCTLNFDTSPHVIGTFIDRRTSDSSGNVGVTVLDRYQPMATSPQKKITLGDATHLSPVLDLSGLGDAFVIPTDGNYAFAFASGAAVTVYTGGRTIAVGDKLVSWDEIPSATFTLSYDGEDRQLGVGVRADGLYVKSTAVPAYARLDIESNPQTWRFYDANGTENTDWEGDVTQEMQVHFSSYEEYLAVKAANVTPGAYVLSGGFALPAGKGLCDMTSGFAFGIAEGLTIDVKGRALKLPASIVGGTKTFTVTSSVAGGELVVDAASGATLENSSMSLTGSLRLVKTGAGTFVAAKADQTYTGGTVVSNGWAKSGAYNGAWGPAKALITIADGAAFDWAGKVSAATQTPYSFVIAGDGPGHTGAMISSVAVDANGWYQMNCIADMELSGDATVVMPGYMGSMANSGAPSFMYAPGNDDQHLLTLNGHTLTIRHGCRMGFRRVKTVGSGTIVNVDNGDNGSPKGISVYAGDDTTDLSSATLDVGLGGVVHAEAKFTVGTFIDRRETYGENPAQNAMMTILDRFQPMTTNLLKTVTLGDATHLAPVLDLSGLDAPFVLPSSGFTMNLAEGATIRLKLGSRKISTKRPVVAWSAENPPASVGSLVFTRGDEDRRYAVTVKDDGVYLNIGFILIVR